MELDGLRYEGCRQHRYDGLLSCILPGYRWSETLFELFGHPTHHMTRVAINGALSRDIGTGFTEVKEWEFEAIVSFRRQTEVWLPHGRDEACSVIGKFTQGSVADGKRLTRRLVIDQGELYFQVRDTRQSGVLVGAPKSAPWTYPHVL